jgi:hypothetical protein
MITRSTCGVAAKHEVFLQEKANVSVTAHPYTTTIELNFEFISARGFADRAVPAIPSATDHRHWPSTRRPTTKGDVVTELRSRQADHPGSAARRGQRGLILN